MELSHVKDYIYIIGAIIGFLTTLVGGIAWLTNIHNNIKENQKLRKEDKDELLIHIDELHKKIDKVETDARQRVEDTFRLFSEIKEQLARWEGKFEVFFKNK